MVSPPSEFVVVDVETTGFRPRYDDVISIDAIRVGGQDNTQRFHSFIRPRKPLRPEVERVTEITNDTLQRIARTPTEVATAFLSFIGPRRLVTYNAEFVVPFLTAVARKAGNKLTNPVSCTLEMAKCAWPGRTKYSLHAVI